MAKKTKAGKTKTLVTLLLDASGSMDLVKDDTIGAINSYVDTLKDSGDDIRFSHVQFNSQWGGQMLSLSTTTSGAPAGVGMQLRKICVAEKISKVPRMTSRDFIPSGGTPLIDAACTTIRAVAASLEGRDDTKVVIAIQTDGSENDSKENTWETLKALIAEKEQLGWEFIFMGCGINAYKQGAMMGIKREKTLSYGKDQAATRAAFEATAMNTVAFASGMMESVAYSDAQKHAAGDK